MAARLLPKGVDRPASKFAIVLMPTPDPFAASACDHPSNPRAARNCGAESILHPIIRRQRIDVEADRDLVTIERIMESKHLILAGLFLTTLG